MKLSYTIEIVLNMLKWVKQQSYFHYDFVNSHSYAHHEAIIAKW